MNPQTWRAQYNLQPWAHYPEWNILSVRDEVWQKLLLTVKKKSQHKETSHMYLKVLIESSGYPDLIAYLKWGMIPSNFCNS